MKLKNRYIACICLVSLVIFVLFTIIVYAHPGRTDSNGGHWDRTNGTYHFHNGEHAGRSSSGSSSKSGNESFIPPYEPPKIDVTEEQGLKKEEKSSTGVWEILEVICLMAFALWVIWAVVAKDFEENGGCIVILFISLIIIYGVRYMITEHLSWLFIGALIVGVFILIWLLLKRIFNNAWKDIDGYQRKLFEFIRCCEELEAKKSLVEGMMVFKIPQNYEIGSDELPKEKGSKGWGKTLTVYKTFNGNKLHKKRGCCSAYIKKHICLYDDYNNPEEHFCRKCCSVYKTPDLSWYKSFLKYKDCVSQYNKLKNSLKRLHMEIKNRCGDCNKFVSNIIAVFNKKYKVRREKLNKLFNDLSDRMNVVSKEFTIAYRFDYSEAEKDNLKSVKSDTNAKENLKEVNAVQLSLFNDNEE